MDKIQIMFVNGIELIFEDEFSQVYDVFLNKPLNTKTVCVYNSDIILQIDTILYIRKIK